MLTDHRQGNSLKKQINVNSASKDLKRKIVFD